MIELKIYFNIYPLVQLKTNQIDILLIQRNNELKFFI